MAAVFALSLVPAGAFAANADSGDAFVVSPATADKGSITIANPTTNATYTAWKILDLASFTDEDNSTDKHSSDRYSYVLKDGSAWKNFFQASEKPGSGYATWGSDNFTVDWDNPVTYGGDTYYNLKPVSEYDNNFKDDSEAKDETSISEWLSTKAAQKFAQAALQYAQDTAGGFGATSAANADSTATQPQFTNLDLGYYIVSSSTGSLVALDTTNKAATVYDKNTTPSAEKKVQEDRNMGTGEPAKAANSAKAADDYWDVDDATIGDDVYYKTVIDVEKGAQNYVLHDTMDAGLTYNGDVAVYYVKDETDLAKGKADESWVLLDAGKTVSRSGASYPAGTAAKTDFYEVDKSGDKSATDTFSVSFAQAFLDWLTDNIVVPAEATDSTTDKAKLVVVYSAKLNEKALVKAANDNRTHLSYGNKATPQSTPEDVTSTYCWPIAAFKYTNTPSNDTPLAGAKFQLWTGETDGTQFKFVEIHAGDYGYDSENSAIPQYKVYSGNVAAGTNASLDLTTDTTDSATDHLVMDTIETSTDGGAGGKFIICGLDEGTYYLRETDEPKGYNKLAWPVKVVVGSAIDGNSTADTPVPTETVQYVYAKTENQTTHLMEYDTTLSTGGLTPAAPISILNQTGSELPSTGGIGTTIFYVAGTVLVVGAGVMLVAKRRMGAEA